MANPLGAYVRKSQNIESVRARHEMLLAGIESPGKVPPLAIKALDTQISFAKLTLKGTKVTSLSRNTLKSLARELYISEAEVEGEGDGHDYLDALRRKLKGLVEGTLASRSAEAKSHRRETSEENLKLLKDEAVQQNIRLSKAYCELTDKLNTFLKEEWVESGTKHRIANILVNHQSIFSDLFLPVLDKNSSADNVLPLNR
jgi:hypothetical protein